MGVNVKGAILTYLQNLGLIGTTYVWPTSYHRRALAMVGHVNVAHTYVSKPLYGECPCKYLEN